MSNNTNFEALTQQVGLEELKDLPKEQILTDVLQASIVGFADGDLAVVHQEEYSGRRAELFGQYAYARGKVARVMGQAAIDNAMNPGELYNYQTFAAEYFSLAGNPFEQLVTQSIITIESDQFAFGQYSVPLDRPPQLVLEYGACLTSRSHTRDQVRMVMAGQRPFTYAPLTRSHFMNQSIIMSYEQSEYGKGTSQEFMHNGYYIGREDGTASATEEIIQAQQAHNVPTEIADLILSINAQHSTEQLLKPGILRAHSLLREDGMLVLRGLVKPGSDEIGISPMTEWALESGFDEKDSARVSSMLNPAVSLLSRDHMEDREVRTVIFQKR